MYSAILIASMFAIFVIVTRLRIKSTREVYHLKLQRLYSEIEFQFIKDKMRLDNETLEFLKTLKFSALNPDFLDIQVLALIHFSKRDIRTIHKVKRDFDLVRKRMSPEAESLYTEFMATTQKIMTMSTYRADFVYWLFKKIAKRIIKAVVKRSLKPLDGLRQRASEVQAEWPEIISFGFAKATGKYSPQFA